MGLLGDVPRASASVVTAGPVLPSSQEFKSRVDHGESKTRCRHNFNESLQGVSLHQLLREDPATVEQLQHALVKSLDGEKFVKIMQSVLSGKATIEADEPLEEDEAEI